MAIWASGPTWGQRGQLGQGSYRQAGYSFLPTRPTGGQWPAAYSTRREDGTVENDCSGILALRAQGGSKNAGVALPVPYSSCSAKRNRHNRWAGAHPLTHTRHRMGPKVLKWRVEGMEAQMNADGQTGTARVNTRAPCGQHCARARAARHISLSLRALHVGRRCPVSWRMA